MESMNPPDKKLRINQVWRHLKKGNLYTVKALANLSPLLKGEPCDPKFPPTVIYQDSNGSTWSREILIWLKKFEYVSEGIPEPKVQQVIIGVDFGRGTDQTAVAVRFSDGHLEVYDRDDVRFQNLMFKAGKELPDGKK